MPPEETQSRESCNVEMEEELKVLPRENRGPLRTRSKRFYRRNLPNFEETDHSKFIQSLPEKFSLHDSMGQYNFDTNPR